MNVCPLTVITCEYSGLGCETKVSLLKNPDRLVMEVSCSGEGRGKSIEKDTNSFANTCHIIQRVNPFLLSRTEEERKEYEFKTSF